MMNKAPPAGALAMSSSPFCILHSSFCIRFDRPFWLAVVVAACVLVPRTVLVSRVHTECWDDLAHLRQGLSLLMRTGVGGDRADPPLGQVLTCLPMVATGCLPPRPESYVPPPDDPPGAAPIYAAPIYGQKWSPE